MKFQKSSGQYLQKIVPIFYEDFDEQKCSDVVVDYFLNTWSLYGHCEQYNMLPLKYRTCLHH